MKNKQADRIDDTQGHGSVSSPGRRLQTGKYTYRPTRIQGKAYVFHLYRPIKLVMEEVGEYFAVYCEKLEINGSFGNTPSQALQEFAYHFEALYETFVVEERHQNRFKSLIKGVVQGVQKR